MSATYYATRGIRFNPPKDTELPILDEITGALIDVRSKPRKQDNWFWLIIRLMTGDDITSVFFAQEIVLSTDVELLNSLHGKTVTLRNKSGTPAIYTIRIESEESIRTRLLDGVVAGIFKMEDLPALLEFFKGNDSQYEQWQLFKQQLEHDGLIKTREEVSRMTTKLRNAIDREQDKLCELNAIYHEVFEKKQELLRELDDALVLMQGEGYPQGTSRSGLNGIGTENLVSIDTGYNKLLQAIEKFRTQKGIFVICGDEIHKIHHAYLEEKGRVFLLGSAQEFNRRGHEESRKIVDRILHLLYPQYHPER